MGPPGPLSLACGNASSCWSQPWGPSAMRTSYQLVSKPIGSSFLGGSRSSFDDEEATQQLIEDVGD